MNQSAGPFMSVHDVSEELGVSLTTVYRLIAAREIPALELGGRLCVPRQAWQVWLEARTKEALAAVREVRPESLEAAR